MIDYDKLIRTLPENDLIKLFQPEALNNVNIYENYYNGEQPAENRYDKRDPSVEVNRLVFNYVKQIVDFQTQNLFGNPPDIINQSENLVQAKTTIGKKKTKWSFFSSNISMDTQIDYFIKMPVSNHVDLNNDYGHIFIDQLDGSCKIYCDYGGIRIGELNNLNNTITMDYGSNSSIDYIHAGRINTDYSSLSIDKADDLFVKADYSNLDIDFVENLNFNCDYGSIKINKAQIVKGDGDYLTLKVYELDDSFRVSCDYGSIKIYQINKGFSKVSIDSDYTGVKLGIAENTNLNFNLTTSYANITIQELEVAYTFKETKMSSKQVKGTINNANSNSLIKVNSSYANIKMYQAD